MKRTWNALWWIGVTLFVTGWLYLTVGAQEAVTIVAPNSDTLTIAYPAGAVHACTVFERQVMEPASPDWPTGKYTPRHCWMLPLEGTSTGYEDNWDYIRTPWEVHVEVQYPQADGSTRTVVSQPVKVWR